MIQAWPQKNSRKMQEDTGCSAVDKVSRWAVSFNWGSHSNILNECAE